MEMITGYAALFLMAIFFAVLIYMEVLLAKTFNKLYSGGKKLAFWTKVSWLRDNLDNFDEQYQDKIKRLVLLQKTLLLLALAMGVFYVLGNIASGI